MTEDQIKALTDSKDLIEALGYVDHILNEEGYATWCEVRCTIARAKTALSGKIIECYVDSVDEGDLILQNIHNTNEIYHLKKTTIAALSGTEVKEVREAVPLEEKPKEDNWYTLVADNALDYEAWYDAENGWDIRPEAKGYAHWLKKTTVRVVKENYVASDMAKDLKDLPEDMLVEFANLCAQYPNEVRANLWEETIDRWYPSTHNHQS